MPTFTLQYAPSHVRVITPFELGVSVTITRPRNALEGGFGAWTVGANLASTGEGDITGVRARLRVITALLNRAAALAAELNERAPEGITEDQLDTLPESIVVPEDVLTREEIIDRLRAAHEAAQGNGDQGAFDVWNVVSGLLIESTVR